MNFENQDLDRLLADSPLDSKYIKLHQQRIRQWLSESNESHFFPIIDTCRFDNSGIIDLDKIDLADANAANIVAFIPAAGASSRFFKVLKESIEKQSPEALENKLQDLNIDSIPLLDEIRAALNNLQQNNQQERRANINKIHQHMDHPKALQPCTIEGATFLELKTRENDLIAGLSGQVFIIPPGFEQEFALTLKKAQPKLPSKTLAQGSKLRTIRFDQDCRAILDDGRPSTVPAGHGMLSQLFCEARFSNSDHSLFIRNIDNVMGASPKAIKSSNDLLSFHNTLLDRIKAIRNCLKDGLIEQAADHALTISKWTKLSDEENSLAEDRSIDFLLRPLVNLFHTPLNLIRDQGPSTQALIDTITNLYNRPINTMGMVPNSGKDVGGTPCFTTVANQEIKLCIEVPHASTQDRDNFLAVPSRATHFNPVFAAAEIPATPDYYHQSDSPFWLIAEKSYRGKKVFYHESILYELLGNSLNANPVFVAIDRSAFNPHKSFQDSAGRSLSHWNL